MIATREQRITAFWARVAVGSEAECWNWTGGDSGNGYGRMRSIENYRRHGFAHRESWTLHNGPVPDGLCVLHRCDNRRCVNPAHLFLGTRQDNMADMKAKGRAKRGEQQWKHRLTEQQVREIRQARAAGARLSVLAARYHVCENTVYDVVRYSTWRHVDL